MNSKDRQVAHLFWTGGWDSTFRFLQLLAQGKTVQPYYLIDSDRLSTAVEMQAIIRIKEKLFEKQPQTSKFVLPTKFTQVCDIRPNEALTQRYERILKHSYMGSQYDWLARFCSDTGIKDIELSIHKDDKAHKILEPFVVQYGSGKETFYKLDENFRETDEYGLFHFFTFPLFNLTKLEMQEIAEKECFEDLMELTWFCHQPRSDLRPCGVCKPCIYTIEEGLGRRIPFSSRVRYMLRIQLKVKRLIGKYPKFHNLLRIAKQAVLKGRSS